MPIIALDGPKLKELETKRTFVKELTLAAVKAYGLPEQSIIIVIRENRPEDVAVGGQLVSDRHPG